MVQRMVSYQINFFPESRFQFHLQSDKVKKSAAFTQFHQQIDVAVLFLLAARVRTKNRGFSDAVFPKYRNALLFYDFIYRHI